MIKKYKLICLFIMMGRRKIVVMMLLMWISQVTTKKIVKKITLATLQTQPSTAFITKFDIGMGTGNITVGYRPNSKTKYQDFKGLDVRVGILNDEQYHQHKVTPSCLERQTLYRETYQLELNSYKKGQHTFQIQENNREHIWYVYVFSCNEEQFRNRKLSQVGLDLDLLMWNNGSHFGEDENLLWGYVILVMVWIGFLVMFMKPIIQSLRHDKPQWIRVLIYSGMIVLGLGYFYRFLDLLLIYKSGRGYTFLYILYVIIKNVVEGFLATIIISIAWGWSLTHLQHDQTYIIIGTLAAILNIVGLVLSNAAEEIEQAHHQYDGTLGTLLLVMRIGLFVLFVVGILRSAAESAGKLKQFIIRFGRMGAIYLLGWPLAVIFGELFLPNYMHKEVITVVEEVTHLVANGMLCRVYTLSDSQYRRVNIKDNDEILPSFHKK